MSKLDSVISRFPPGSGRQMDYTWPDWNANNSNGGAVTNQIRDRPGAQAADPAGAITTNVTGLVNVGVVNGVSCCRMTNAAGLTTGPTVTIDGAGRFHPSGLFANVKFPPQSTDSYAIHRVYAIMRVAATPGDAADMGLQIILGPNATNGILRNNVPGFGINFDNTGNCSYLQHGASTAQTSTLLLNKLNGYLNTDFHKYELQMINATPFVNGFIRVLIDDIPLLTKSFGSSADDLPVPTSPGATFSNGYVVDLQCQARNSEIDVALVRCQRAPFLGAL